MTTIQLNLDEATIERARRLAAARGTTLEELFTNGLTVLEASDMQEDALLGLFADAEELLDQITEETMQARERDAFR